MTYLTKCCTRSYWDHVGMVLKFSDRPDERILIESAGCGVFLCYAKQRIEKAMAEGTVLGYRQLVGGSGGVSQAVKERMKDEAQLQVEKPYEQCFGEIFKAFLGQDGDTANSLMKSMGAEWAQGGENPDSFFCSELVAHLLKVGNVLSEEKDANMFLPKDFATQDNSWIIRAEKEAAAAADKSADPNEAMKKPLIRKPYQLKHETKIVEGSATDDSEKKKTHTGQGASMIEFNGKSLTIASMLDAHGGDRKKVAKANMEAFETISNKA
eukprot:TRINITY_DN13882_c0_g1_i4.p1 TRINITY_DN13882_c0_g1~~TRINITY_DN13882_c0_g1_i4.p1  ORF type:complete len:268 (-),score=51.03 TRINITY_DN13882_c0_g1_i4:544-1347(-)